MLISIKAAVAATLVMATVPAAANLVANGSFEAPPTTLRFYPVGSTAITNWTVVNLPGGSGNIQHSNNSDFGALGVVASDGVQYLDLTGNIGRGGGIQSDAFATTVGTRYAVSFDVGAIFVAGFGSFGDSIVDLYIDGDFAGSYLNTMSLNSPGTDYQRFSQTFVAAGPTSTVAFYSSQSMASSNLGVIFDKVDVSVAGVPEPATWAMLIGGFAMVGAAARRRRAVAA